MRRPSLALLAALAPALVAACTPTRSADASPPAAPPSVSAMAPATPPPVTRAPAARPSASMYPRPSKAELASRLTPMQFDVTQNAGTEPPFQNAYWNNHEAGLYVDVVTGEPLFTSLDKFESGTGWPSFTRPADDLHVVERTDTTFGISRTEVVSSAGASHLGHVFDDGPAPTGKRYCINSAALRFIPVARLAAEGYAVYAARFGAASSP